MGVSSPARKRNTLCEWGRRIETTDVTIYVPLEHQLLQRSLSRKRIWLIRNE